MISYKPFFETLKRKGISQYALETKYDVPKATMTSLRHNKNIELLTIEHLCKLLDCKIWEVVEFIDDDAENTQK